MGGILLSRFGSHIGKLLSGHSYWAVALRDGTWVSEIDHYPGIRLDHPHYDWSLDLVGTGDHKRVAELWLICPATKRNPFGSTAHYTFGPHEGGRAVQFKRKTLNPYGIGAECQVIGKITDPATGEVNCCIWDGRYKVMVVNFVTTIHNFASWDEAVRIRLGLERLPATMAPPGQMSKNVLGL